MQQSFTSKKEILLVLFVALLSQKTGAQIEKRNWLLGGTGSFSYSQAKATNRTYKVSNLELSPAAGYFIFNRFAAGLRPILNIETNRSTPNHKNRTTSIAIGPFLRYYFLPTEKKLNIFTEAGYGYSFSKYTQFDGIYDESWHSSLLYLRTGAAYFINRHTALEVSLGYTYSTRGPIDTLRTHSLRLGVGFQIHL